MKIAFVTSLFGDRGNNPAKFERVEGCDYFLFSDRSQESFNTSWDVYNISNNSNISNLNCNIRKSRYAKFMGWELLESMGLKYDFIYYCDAHWSPLLSENWRALSSNVLKLDFPFWQDKHLSKLRGVMDEVHMLIHYRKDSSENIEKTLSFFRSNYSDINLSVGHYFENTMFGYHPNDIVKSITKEFWETYTTKDITFRDQPLWNVLLLKNEVLPFFDVSIRKQFTVTGSLGDHSYVP